MDSQPLKHTDITAAEEVTSRPPSLTTFIKVITFFTAIGGFLFGYNVGIISGAMILLKRQYNLDIHWQEGIASITIASAALASLVGGFLNDLLGRRPVILSASAIFTLGAAVLAVAPDKEVLFVGRLVVGFGVGFVATSAPVYLTELAPAHARGQLVILHGCCIAIGTATSGVAAGAFSFYPWGWRAMFGIVAIPAIIQFIGLLFLPESPRWLMRHGQDQKAKDVLLKVHGVQLATEEYASIHSAEIAQRLIEQEHKDRSIILQVFQSPAVLRALLVGCGLQFIQQMAGINTIIHYGGSIIRLSGVKSDVLTIWLNTMVTPFSLIGNLISLYLVGKFGRKTLALGSLAGIIASLLYISTSFLSISITSPPATSVNPNAGICASYGSCSACITDENCGFCSLRESERSFHHNSSSCLPVNQTDFTYSSSGRCSITNTTSDTIWAIDFCTTSFWYLAILGLVAYLLSFGMGMGPMPWLVNTEIYPTWARGFCNGCATATNWACNLLISTTFLTLTHRFSPYGAFILYACIAMLGFIFLYAFQPETKDTPLEDVMDLFAKPMCASSYCGDGSVAYHKLKDIN